MSDESIAGRLNRLRGMGAGDEQCKECMRLNGKPHPITTCSECIARTEEFTRAINAFMREPATTGAD